MVKRNSVVDAFKTFVNQQRGIAVNMDTKGESGPGWEIRISGNGERNTIAHSGGAGLSVDALTAIRGLIENATLLDTEVHEHHSNNSKTPATDSFEKSAVFIDGTKIEANAGRYTFVWKTAVNKHQSRLGERIATELPLLPEKAGVGIVMPKQVIKVFHCPA